MWPDQVLNPGPLTFESGALPTALRGLAPLREDCIVKGLHHSWKKEGSHKCCLPLKRWENMKVYPYTINNISIRRQIYLIEKLEFTPPKLLQICKFSLV